MPSSRRGSRVKSASLKKGPVAFVSHMEIIFKYLLLPFI
uniref:Uncharacterized protein n=1 Tax=Arundo donax TaxID=35708 RepID=A0A0A8ZIL4_ARUDO